MAPSVRVARAGDGERVASLYRAAVAETLTRPRGVVLLDEDRLEEPLGAACEYLIASDEAVVVVGEVAGETAGFAMATHRPGPPATARLAALFVDEHLRGDEVGSAILRELEARCSEGGARALDIPVAPGARLAKVFLEGAGYVTRQLLMHRVLVPPADGA